MEKEIKKEVKIKQELGTTLSYRRALEITDASMFSVSSENQLTRIAPYRHGMRTSLSFDKTTTKENTKKRSENSVANLSLVEMAKLNREDNILLIDLNILFLPIYTTPEITSDYEKMELFISKNKELLNDENSLMEVSKYYAYKIINASWSWRNRDIAKSIKVIISSDNKDFNDIELENVKKAPLNPILTNSQKELGDEEPLNIFKDEVNQLSSYIRDVFYGDKSNLSLTIKGYFEIQKGATIYPSQVFTPEPIKIGKSPLGKILYTLPFNNHNISQVGITAEKINNALRKFDLVIDKNGNEKIISIDPNGSDMTTNTALRNSGKRLIDLYKVLIFENDSINKLSQNDKIFIIGCLIRGGLFQESK